MTEAENPQKTKPGSFRFLGKRKTQRRAFHISTRPGYGAVRLLQNLNLKGASSTTAQALVQAHPSIGKDCLITIMRSL
jgi:hypothetical protein